MRHVKTALMVGLMVLPVAMLAGCGGGAAARSGVDQNIKNAKLMVADLKGTFEAGETIKVIQSDRPNRPDARMGIVALMLRDKIRATIEKRVADDDKRTKALAKLKESNDYLNNEILPKYGAAQQSKKADDAKALVPMMDQLDKQLDELNDILNS